MHPFSGAFLYYIQHLEELCLYFLLEGFILKVAAIDLFCGIGGLTKGVSNSGIKVIAGIDIDSESQFAYESNNDACFINKDVTKVTAQEILDLYPADTDVKILMGCAPCQPFSTYNQKNGKNRKNVDLIGYFSKLIADVQPHIVAMENVPQLSKEKVFESFLEALSQNGYEYTWEKVFSPDYGVPQTRHRLILLASKFSKISLIPKKYTEESYLTVRDIIGNLPFLNSGEINRGDLLHRSVKLNEKNINRIMQSVPGGTWRDWDEDIRLECHKKDSGKSYDAVYGRMRWDKPAPTITTKFYGYGNGRFGHPDQNRALSYREGALLQTFPIDYKFYDVSSKFSGKKLGIQIGNAVPVKLGEVIGESIITHLLTLNN